MQRAVRTFTSSMVLFVCASMSQQALAFTVPPNDGFVTDTANILSLADRQKLADRITDYQKTTSNEIAIVIVQSLEGTTIEEAALTIARKWGVGSTKNNGILILVSYADRSVRIEVGYGLEGAVPDIVAKGIIEEDISPRFRNADYYGGLSQAIDSLQKHIGGEYTQDRYMSHAQENSPWSFIFFFGFVVFQWLLAILGRTKSWWLGGVFGAIGGIMLVAFFGWWYSIPILILLGLLLDFIVSKVYAKRGATPWWAGGGWGPGGGGFSSGGGFGGFGGGSFGGGGASGRW